MKRRTQLLMTSGELVAATGISYRQLNYWITQGVIPEDLMHGRYGTVGGSGHHRRFDVDVLPPLQVVAAVALAFGESKSVLSADLLADIFAVADDGQLALSRQVALRWTL